MAHTSKDGKFSATNASAVRHYERRQSAKSDKAAPKAAQKPMGVGASGADEGQDVSSEDIHSVVAEHGPAHKVETKKEGEKHTVTSHHGEEGSSVKHHSEHDSPEAAHEQAGHAMGVGGDEPEESESAGMDSDSGSEPSFSLPGLQ